MRHEGDERRAILAINRPLVMLGWPHRGDPINPTMTVQSRHGREVDPLTAALNVRREHSATCVLHTYMMTVSYRCLPGFRILKKSSAQRHVSIPTMKDATSHTNLTDGLVVRSCPTLITSNGCSSFSS